MRKANHYRSLILSAMQNSAFMDYTKQESNQEAAADIQAFFSDEIDPCPGARLDQLTTQTLDRIWRYFVAYTLECSPYSAIIEYHLRHQCADSWNRLGLLSAIHPS